MKEAKGSLAWLLLLALGFTWGSSFMLMKQGLLLFSSVQIACLRIFLSWLVLFPYVLYNFKRIPWNRWWMFLIAGMLGNGIPSFMFPIAQTHLDSSLVGMLNSIMPLLTLLFGGLFFGMIINSKKVIGIVLGIIGVILLLAHKMNNSSDLSYASFVLIASTCYAINTNFLKKKMGDIDAVMLTAVSFTFIGPPAGIQLLSTDFISKMHTSQAWAAFGLISILAVFGTALAVIVFNYLVKVKSALFAASVTYIVPVFAILWGIVFQENIVPLQYVGMAVVLGGVYLVNS